MFLFPLCLLAQLSGKTTYTYKTAAGCEIKADVYRPQMIACDR
jgi:hypothetical protein